MFSKLKYKKNIFNFFSKKKNLKTNLLENNPFKKGICVKIRNNVSPKKPNSASRKVANVRINNNKRKILQCYIPGEGHNLEERNIVLIRGGSVRDLPSINLRLVRGKYDFLGLKNRKQARSKYGTKKTSK